MNRNKKRILSAMTAAVLCTANMPAFTASSGIIIDHSSSGTDKGYYYEYTNNDDDSNTVMSLEPGCNYKCSWDNDEDFTAARGLKFASPVEYAALGSIEVKYWKRFDVESFSNNNGYVRFGVRVRNTKGETFTVMEVDTEADGKALTEKEKSYRRIGTVRSYEVFNDSNIFGPAEGDRYEVPYTVYSNDDGSVLCMRDTPLEVNTDIEDSRRIGLSDKLDAIAALGYDIGEVTDITLFLDASYSKGEGTVYAYDISVYNMPEAATDECEEGAPLLVTDYDYGERDGYYYYMSCLFHGQMKVMEPSLFKAEWDSSENSYDRDPVFERGKKFESGQSYKALEDSSAEYTMDIDADGKYSVSTYACLSGPNTEEYNYQTDIYIVDACKDWTVSQYAEKIGELTDDGHTYDIYYYMSGLEGSFKSCKIANYYFVSRDAEANGMKGSVSVKHQLKPFTDVVNQHEEHMGNPAELMVMLNGGVSSGSAELTKNEIAIPDYINDEEDDTSESRRIYISTALETKTVDGLTYSVMGDIAFMEGYAGDKINCIWNAASKANAFYSVLEGQHRFIVNRNFMPFRWSSPAVSWAGFGGDSSPDASTSDIDGNILIDYNIDLGELSDEKEDSNIIIGGQISCFNENVQTNLPYDEHSDIVREYSGYNIIVEDSFIRKPGKEINPSLYVQDKPEKLGVIESGGVKYDAEIYYPDTHINGVPCIILTRQEPLKNVDAADVPEGHKRYVNTIDATDIVDQLKKLDIDPGEIENASFVLETYGNSGTAVINSADIRAAEAGEKTYTIDDITLLSDFLHGKTVDIPAGTDYDLNDDGIWNVYDLCIMRKEVGSAQT